PGSGPAPVARETAAGLAVGSLLVARGEDCRMARGLSTTSSPLCCRTRADFSGSGPGRPQSASARLSRFFSTAASGSVEGAGCPAEELDSAAARYLFAAHPATASGSAAMAEAAAAGDSAAAVAEAAAAVDSAAAVRFLAHLTAAVR